MNDSTPASTAPASLAIPDRADADRAVDAARRQFRRILCSWASDLLELRRSGHARASWADGVEHAVAAVDPPSGSARDEGGGDELDPGLDLAA